MHTVKHDIQKNRLYVTLVGVLNIPEAQKIKEEMFNSIEKLLLGFDVVTDLSKYIQGDDNAAAILDQIGKFVIEKKVNRIVRVVGQSKTGLLQFAKYTNEEEALHIKYVPTLEEAELYLSNNLKENAQ